MSKKGMDCAVHRPKEATSLSQPAFAILAHPNAGRSLAGVSTLRGKEFANNCQYTIHSFTHTYHCSGGLQVYGRLIFRKQAMIGKFHTATNP